MKKRDGLEPDIDGLLRQTMQDDLPPEVRARMKRRLDQFRRLIKESAKEEIRPALAQRRPWILLARPALAALAVFFIVLGFSLPGAGRRSVLSDSVTAYQKVAVISGEISAARAMECVVQFSKGGELQQEFRIQWLPSGRALVRILGPDREISREITMPAASRSVLEHYALSASAAGEKEPELDAELLPVEGLLSPSRLVGLLQGAWKPEGSERQGDCDMDSFSISGSRLEPPSRITVDGCTGLPTRLVREVTPGERVEAVFRWGSSESAPAKLSLSATSAEKTRTLNS